MIEFSTAFKELTGFSPFLWQADLFERWISGRLETDCSLPTGVGKTSVIAIWLIALAQNPDLIPRRLVYVVNRRTVVDQTSSEVLNYMNRLEGSQIAEALRNLCVIDLDENESPLAVSTLRGQLADNRQWSGDPCRPAIVVGTVDMIGSRLLFGGYQIGFKSLPLHAGFLGQDTLVVHDEAHLEPAFQTVLDSIRAEQRRCGDDSDYRPLRLVTLSATQRGMDEESGREKFSLSAGERESVDGFLARRLSAIKHLRLHSIKDAKSAAMVSRITELALQNQNTGETVLVFVRLVSEAEKISAGIAKELRKTNRSLSHQVATLTGTMRGFERDRLLVDPVFQRFLPGTDEASTKKPTDPPRKGTVYLVCTSAGEVGINLSAKHLVCDLTTFESMAQRFGRVNRFGEFGNGTDEIGAGIDVVYPELIPDGKKEWEKNYNKSLRNTLNLLRSLGGDASPRALEKIDDQTRTGAFSPLPGIAPTSEVLFDAWALTSIRETLPGRPPLQPYLHGITESEPPRTRVIWREEVERIDGDRLLQFPPNELLEAWPVKPQEVVEDLSDRVSKELKNLSERKPKADDEPIPKESVVWVEEPDGEIRIWRLGVLVDRGKEALEGRTVFLPPSLGALGDSGMLSGNARKSDRKSDASIDVSEEWLDEAGNRLRFRRKGPPREVGHDPAGHRLIMRIDLSSDLESVPESDQEAEKEVWFWYERLWGGDGNRPESADQSVKLDDHSEHVAALARGFADELKLPAETAEAVELAANCHDLGKARTLWQASIGNHSPGMFLAKSGRGMKPMKLGFYRHEFGSLVDLSRLPEFNALSPDGKDLVLHLVAAHHGRARPHFPSEECFDPESASQKSRSVAAEVPLRYERLQRKYGRWGLAWIESLIRAADYAASAGKTARPKQK